jgi:hypothetical protein
MSGLHRAGHTDTTLTMASALDGTPRGIAGYVIREMRNILPLPDTDFRQIPLDNPGVTLAALPKQRSIKLLVNAVIAIMLLLAAWNFLVKFLGHEA